LPDEATVDEGTVAGERIAGQDAARRWAASPGCVSYAIIGFGAVGQALARAFARKNREVAVASRRTPEALAPQARATGPTITPKTLAGALEAQTVILAVPFWEHREVAKALASWQGKTVIDTTNAFGGGRPVKGGRRVVFLSILGAAAATSNTASAVAVQPDGRIVVAGLNAGALTLWRFR
jgi:predicted dinucleotide-binding enzyme